jgi:hypothetical protein
MKPIVIRVAFITTAAVALMAGCAAPPATNRAPRTVAIIMSGDVVSYSSPGFGAQVRVVEIDGKPVAEPWGPLELKPGRHTVTLQCDGATKPLTLNVAAGEVYQFTARTSPGVKGCVGALARVRTTNP